MISMILQEIEKRIKELFGELRADEITIKISTLGKDWIITCKAWKQEEE